MSLTGLLRTLLDEPGDPVLRSAVVDAREGKIGRAHV